MFLKQNCQLIFLAQNKKSYKKSTLSWGPKVQDFLENFLFFIAITKVQRGYEL